MDLVKLLNHLDYECDAATKEAKYQSLPHNVQEALEELWAKYYAAPKNKGHWIGEPCNSIWVPDDSVVPPNKSYSNQFGLSWGEIKKKHSFEGLRCDRGRFCFEDIALYKVTIPNFSELVNSTVRTSLHEAAFAKLANDLEMSVEEIKAFKESRNNQTPMGHKNLAWHEDVDCSTLYLVPQEIHGNIPHFGGIAMCQILKNHNLL